MIRWTRCWRWAAELQNGRRRARRLGAGVGGGTGGTASADTALSKHQTLSTTIGLYPALLRPRAQHPDHIAREQRREHVRPVRPPRYPPALQAIHRPQQRRLDKLNQASPGRPYPPRRQEEQEQRGMTSQQRILEHRRREHLLPHEPPIDRPRPQKRAAELERPADIPRQTAVLPGHERQRQHNLNLHHQHRQPQRLRRIRAQNIDQPERGQVQQRGHLNPNRQRSQHRRQRELPLLQHVHRPEDQQRAEAVVEEAEQVDAVQPLRKHQQHHDPRRRLGRSVAGHREPQCREVGRPEHRLRRLPLRAAVGYGVEPVVDVDVSGRVDQRARAAFDVPVVPFSRAVLRDLLHLRTASKASSANAAWREYRGLRTASIPHPTRLVRASMACERAGPAGGFRGLERDPGARRNAPSKPNCNKLPKPIVMFSPQPSRSSLSCSPRPSISNLQKPRHLPQFPALSIQPTPTSVPPLAAPPFTLRQPSYSIYTSSRAAMARMGSAAGRDRSVKRSLGPLHAVIKKSKVLMVGAGGIGCELLKNLVLTGFGEIHIVDLDTIDLSNLNRQFLFGRQHIKKSKALVAKETASKFNPNVNLIAYHANIKDSQFNVEWFRGFDIVFNALDNLDARRHVNQMCLAANVPLVESGTTGFNGQVQVIAKGVTECYDCTTKPVPKTFPVCTIRSTPSQPIHCIVWAKSYLFNELFGASEDESGEFDHSEDAENAQEIKNLRQEAAELKRIRETLGQPEFAENVFEKVFNRDIIRLAEMKDMWKTRKAPNPLSFKTLSADLENKTPPKNDQKSWTLVENYLVFADSLDRLSKRVQEDKKAGKDPILSFDKDDEDTLDFVAASANIRSHVFGIAGQSKFDIKQMAGNIIPAIATTNAITAGLCVTQAFKILKKKISDARMVFLSMSSDRGLTTEALRPPNPSCQVCGVARVDFECDTKTTTLEEFKGTVLQSVFKYGESISLIHEKLIYDEDYDDNLESSFAQLGIKDGSFLTVIDESDDDNDRRVNFIFQIKEKPQGESEPPFVIPARFEIPKRPTQPPSLDSLVLSGRDHSANGTLPGKDGELSRKRKADDDLTGENEHEPHKKVKAANDIIVIDDGFIEID
ncbi:Ubiquitin-activating enzyme E1-li [Drechslerella dactyloides]|uniref:Ubiquitin-activating enzyme E1-like n=1 Tax=Drechslerella dactyloides TaxID=74499 RepID=A0AAD6NI27_DREDA|nr:Ubiquitin-activating enzyme E1-li [Drechslerella dactyloides]